MGNCSLPTGRHPKKVIPQDPSDQFGHRLPIVHQIVGTTRVIWHGNIPVVDAKMVVKGGVDLAKMNGALGDRSTDSVGGPDDLPGSESSPGNKAPADLRPMVPTSVLVDLRRSSKLTPCHHGDILVQTAFMQVCD